MLSSTPTTSGWPSGTNAATSRPSKILEPCRPDHAPRDRNRWNRLKPLSDAPSTARRAAQTVRWFRHSNAPVASATAFNQVGCVNSTANGASQVSIARAFPGCAIFATIGFPMRQTHGKLRSCLQNLQISAQAADYGDTTEQPGKPPKSRLSKFKDLRQMAVRGEKTPRRIWCSSIPSQKWTPKMVEFRACRSDCERMLHLRARTCPSYRFNTPSL